MCSESPLDIEIIHTEEQEETQDTEEGCELNNFKDVACETESQPITSVSPQNTTSLEPVYKNQKYKKITKTVDSVVAALLKAEQEKIAY